MTKSTVKLDSFLVFLGPLFFFFMMMFYCGEAWVSPSLSNQQQQTGVLLRRSTNTRTRTRTQQELQTKTNVLLQAVLSEPPKIDSSGIEMGSYMHDNYWKVTYRSSKTSSSSSESSSSSDHPILFIHPVGIGLSSWFWEPLMTALKNTNEEENENSENHPRMTMYAPNLIGCGTKEGTDPWNPSERGLSFPLGWVKGCESLVQHIEEEQWQKEKETSQSNTGMKNLFQQFQPNKKQQQQQKKKKKWTIVVQGGLAPVGVMIASRNPEWVERLILTSPPTWDEMTTSISEIELQRNYKLLSSPIIGKWVFDNILERSWAIEFFSNLFLFSKSCDTIWLQNTKQTCCINDRSPVWAFNAGLCQHRSYKDELTSLTQSTLILSGQDDPRNKNRKEYKTQMKDCQIIQTTIPGQNVIPWESPQKVAQIVKDFIMS